MTDTAIPHPLARRIAPPRMPGMPAAFRERPARNDLRDMPFGDRPAPPVDREVVERRPRALQRRLRRARPRHRDACFEDIDVSRRRGLRRGVVPGLGDCARIRNGANIPVTGPCGTGKGPARPRARPQGVPRRLPGPVPARSAAAHRAADRARRGRHSRALPRSRQA